MSIGSDVRLDEETRNKLIGMVKMRSILYNDCADRTRELVEERQQLWEDIGQELKIPAEICKVKFTNLKNNYFKNLKNDSVGPEMRRRLEFLNDLAPWNRLLIEKPARITQRRATKRSRPDYSEDSNSGILVNTSTTSEIQETSNHYNGGNTMHSNVDQGLQNTAQMPHSSNQNKNDDNHNVDAYQNGHPQQNVQAAEKSTPSHVAHSLGAENSDDLTLFFRSMEQTARKFSARLQVKVKRMISDIIYDAEDQWLSTQLK